MLLREQLPAGEQWADEPAALLFDNHDEGPQIALETSPVVVVERCLQISEVHGGYARVHRQALQSLWKL